MDEYVATLALEWSTRQILRVDGVCIVAAVNSFCGRGPGSARVAFALGDADHYAVASPHFTLKISHVSPFAPMD